MNALDSLVDFAALISSSTANTNANHTDNDDDFIPLPQASGSIGDEATTGRVKMQQEPYGLNAKYWTDLQQGNALFELYQKPLPAVYTQIDEPRDGQDIRPDFRPQWTSTSQPEAYMGHEVHIKQEPFLDRQMLGDFPYMPSWSNPYPIDSTRAIKQETYMPYQHPAYFNNAAEERRFAMPDERVYGNACADPRCDCRSFVQQAPYGMGGQNALYMRDNWETIPMGFGGPMRGVGERWAGWGMGEEQMRMVHAQPY
jgi:hypothetical protein